ncbi:sugar phosphate nucleotidyltransferase [Ferrovum sp.]|uniref:nucleotidyltransferase family protein n=1 Tax=Ferrovum sp. TaxID=2609467 RepID=UPI00263601D8|nr:sugar phosphate nucleotidyltransferase [Ferrovum sp.]
MADTVPDRVYLLMPQAMILAAGRGERLRPFTDQRPKPLLPVRGKPLIEWQIEGLVRAGFDEIVVNGAWLAEPLESYLAQGQRWGIPLHWSREDQALGTAGGVAQALPFLTDPVFAVVSADIHTTYAYERLRTRLERWRDAPEGEGTDPPVLAHLVLVEDARYPRDFSLDAEDRVTLPAGRAGTYGNIGLFRRSFFTPLRRGENADLGALLRNAVSRRQVSGEWNVSPWINVGTLAEWQRAENPPKEFDPCLSL